MHNHFANRNDIANIFITISLKLAFSLEFNQFFCDCTSIFRNHSFVCFYVQETSGEWRNGVREKLFGGCTMCIQTNTHKLFVPCHKLWIFDQSQVSIQNAMKQTIERSLSLSLVSFGKKRLSKQPLVFVTVICRFKFRRGISTAILSVEEERDRICFIELDILIRS